MLTLGVMDDESDDEVHEYMRIAGFG